MTSRTATLAVRALWPGMCLLLGTRTNPKNTRHTTENAFPNSLGLFFNIEMKIAGALKMLCRIKAFSNDGQSATPPIHPNISPALSATIEIQAGSRARVWYKLFK
jgi:hypothetical protein